MSANAIHALPHPSRQPYAVQPAGSTQPIHSSTWDSQYDDDDMHASSDRANALRAKASRDRLGGAEYDAVDYPKGSVKGRTGNPASVRGRTKKQPSKTGSPDPNWTAPESDENNWIHRDKLKEIEIKEMEAAGFRVGHSSRSNSRSQSTTRRNRDRTNSGAQADDRYESRRTVAPIPAEDDGAWSGGNAPELQASSRSTNSARPSTSRIPLPKTSGIPVPASLADRDAPLPRSRTNSTNWTHDIAANGARVRSGSIGSQALLDDVEDDVPKARRRGHNRDNSSSGSGSSTKTPPKTPAKAKTPGKSAVSGTGSRKTSAQRTPAKPRQASTAKRPGTSGGGVSRPTTGHRPEGEAPWLATMYKPDPRLPPDQQIIPTHAKRMQQEQWETEGRVGSMYDTDFRLLNTDGMESRRASQMLPGDYENAQENDQWPLPSPPKPASEEKLDTNTSKSPTQEQPGYRLTPTIPQTTRVPSPPPVSNTAAVPEKPEVTRVPEPVEEVKEKKGHCCIVM
jgi:hypothetical protein